MDKGSPRMNKQGIYVILNKVNSKVYIGSTISMTRRRGEHLGALKRNKHYVKHLQRAWNKYGETAFIFKIVEQVSDAHVLLEREQAWLDMYTNAYPDLVYNAGHNARRPAVGLKRSEETKRKIAAWHKGRPLSEETKRKLCLANLGKKCTPETVQKMINASTGKNNSCFGKFGKEHPAYGRKASEEDLIKQRKGIRLYYASDKVKTRVYKTGFKLSEETRHKISLSHNGRVYGKMSEEVKRKMRIAKLGSKNPNFGKPLSREHKEKIRNTITGMKRSDATRERVRLSKLGNKNPNFGRIVPRNAKGKFVTRSLSSIG